MARFRFPLEALLTFRRHTEREKQLGVARLEVERRGVERVIVGYQERIREGKADLRRVLAPGTAPVDPRAARLQASVSLHLQLKAQRSAVSLAGVLKRLGDARDELKDAAVDRRAIERLKEKRREAWLAEQSRAEAAMLDEIGTMRAARKSGRGAEEVSS